MRRDKIFKLAAEITELLRKNKSLLPETDEGIEAEAADFDGVNAHEEFRMSVSEFRPRRSQKMS